MERATLPQLIRSHKIARELGHMWSYFVDVDEMAHAFELGGIQAVDRLAKSMRDTIDKEYTYCDALPSTASVTSGGQVRWSVDRDGALTVEVKQAAGHVFTVKYDPDGNLVRATRGRRRLPVGGSQLELVAKIVTAAFHEGRQDRFVRTYHHLAALLAARCPEDPEDPLDAKELPEEPLEFFRAVAAVKECGFPGFVRPEHIEVAFEAIRKTRPMIFMSDEPWNDRPPSVEIFTDAGREPGRPLTDEEKAAILAAVSSVRFVQKIGVYPTKIRFV